MNFLALLLLNLSDRAYAIIVKRYPIAVRARYESEMREVFHAQIQDAWLENGIAGLVRVWLKVAMEISRFTLPVCLRVGGIGLISGLSSLLLFYIFSLDALPFYSSLSCSAEVYKQKPPNSTHSTRSQEGHFPKAKIPDGRTWYASDPL